MNINTRATLSTTINVRTNVIDVRATQQLIIHFEPRFPSSIHLNFMKTACRCSIEQKERQQTDRDRDTRLYTCIHTHEHTNIHTYKFARVTFAVVYRKAGSGKKRKRRKRKKKKEKTNISRLRTVNSHSRSLKKEREREKRKYLGRNWQMTETSSCSCTGHSPQGNLSRYIHIYEYIFRGYGCSQPASIELSREIHPLEEGDGFERGAELDYGRLNCTTRALFCLPSSGVLIHGARAFKVSKPRKLYCRT